MAFMGLWWWIGCGPASSPTPLRAPDDDLSADDTFRTGPVAEPPTVGVTLLPLPAPNLCATAGTSWFEDVSTCAGVSQWHLLGPHGAGWYVTGQGILDVDDDGLPDLVLTSHGGPSQLLHNLGGGRFASQALPEPTHPGGPVAAADVDGDGHLDLAIGSEGTTLLYPGGPDGFGAPIAYDVPGLPHGVTLGDLDEDGVLEVYVTNYQCLGCDTEDALFSSEDRLLAYDGTDLTATLGDPLLRSGLGFATRIHDFDGDGDQDVYVVNDRGTHVAQDPTVPLGRNAYFEQQPSGFVERALENGSDLRIDGMGIALGDLDGDGDTDGVMTSTDGLWVMEAVEGHRFRVHHDWRGLVSTDVLWGVVALDIDNDADLDVVAAGILGGRVFENDGSGLFTVHHTTGIEVPGAARGLAQGDVDRDGRVDLLEGRYGQDYRLFRNRHPNRHHWVGVELRGHGAGGTHALDAMLEVTDSEGRVQRRWVSAGSSMAANHDHGLHVGLGNATLDSARVIWPDGTVQPVELTVDRWQRVMKTL